MTVPRAVLFDLDGVLIDSYWVWFHLINHAARELGYPAVDQGSYYRSWGQSTTADRDRFFPRHSVQDVERFYGEHYFEHVSCLTVLPGVVPLFEELRSRGVKTAVVTNSQRSLAVPLVERTSVRPDVVVAGGDAARGKPAPDPLLLACERLGVRPEDAWMVGDSVFDRDAARAAGIFFVGVGIDGDRRVSAASQVLDRAPAPATELDGALTILDRFGEEYGGGLSNHGPMAAEALVALGRSEAVLPWVERYLGRLERPVPPTGRIDPERYRGALGSASRLGDWRAFFENEVSEASVSSVLETWLPRLLPGFGGGACHGAIRVSHAVRALSRAETFERRRELARALAYWAACYETLPGEPSRPGSLSPRQALERVPSLPKGERRMLISDELRRLGSIPSFADVVDLLDSSLSEDELLDQMTSLFARVYLQNAAHSPIVFVHAVTGPAALRQLLPYLEPADRASGVRYAWQAAAALYAAYGSRFDEEREPGGADVDPEVLGGRASENGDEHAIKLTEVCVREWRRSGDPALLGAARDALERL
jgi:HAD superfamily hydrolase (TIGR01509 family)